MAELDMKSPWAEYAMKVRALFEKDPDTLVVYENEDPCIKLYVDDAIKANALQKMQELGKFPAEREFGGVTLKVEVIPANGEPTEADLYAAAFNGNPVFEGLATVDQMGFNVTYALFAPVAVQYYADDLSEYGGVRTTTYEELAREVFEQQDVRISSAHLKDIVY